MPTMVQNFPHLSHKFYFCQNQLEVDFLLLIVKTPQVIHWRLQQFCFFFNSIISATINLVVGFILSLADGNLLDTRNQTRSCAHQPYSCRLEQGRPLVHTLTEWDQCHPRFCLLSNTRSRYLSHPQMRSHIIIWDLEKFQNKGKGTSLRRFKGRATENYFL